MVCLRSLTRILSSSSNSQVNMPWFFYSYLLLWLLIFSSLTSSSKASKRWVYFEKCFCALTKEKFQHNHNQMSVFRFFAILAAVVAPIQLIVKIFTLGQYSRHQVQRDPTEGLIISIFTCILAIYFGCCVNSLYLQIEEEKLPVTVSSQAQVRPTHNDKSLS